MAGIVAAELGFLAPVRFGDVAVIVIAVRAVDMGRVLDGCALR
jgi:acyl-CoA thioesterase FadM